VEFDAVEAEFLVEGKFFGKRDGGADGWAEGIGALVDVPWAEGEAVVRLVGHG